MKELNNKNYIAIADWMLSLGLNTRELLVYAIIYGFSQNEEGFYYGSYNYLASWLGIDDSKNVTRYLKPLVDKKLVIKKEARSKLNQKMCIYKTTECKGNIINNPDVDYLIIQPWMLQQLHLNGKDLLLYALIHGYSRKESNNICEYKKSYYAKWLQCRKDHVDRQIQKLLDTGLIKKINTGYVAMVPENISIIEDTKTSNNLDDIDVNSLDNTYTKKITQTEGTLKMGQPQPGSTLTQTEGTFSPKLRDNNLNNNLIDNLNVVVNAHARELLDAIDEYKIMKEKPSYVIKELEAYEYQCRFETKIYNKYSNRKYGVNLLHLVGKCSMQLFRYLAADWPTIAPEVKQGYDLVINTLTGRNFKKHFNEINNASTSEIVSLFQEAESLFRDSNFKEGRKKTPLRTLTNIIFN